jgi:hypothetical protein
MNEKTNIVTVLAACLLLLSTVQQARAEEAPYKEYEVKAAFMYQFVNFIDGWKFQQKSDEGNGENADDDKPIVIGIIGKNPFQDAFVPLKAKQIKDKNVVVKYFKGLSELNSDDEKVALHPEIERIKQCDLLFICSSEHEYIKDILNPIRHEPILTIADTHCFVESGGVINFIMDKNKVRFEINTAAAHRAKLKIRSKLLRLAKRILKDDDIEEE